MRGTEKSYDRPLPDWQPPSSPDQASPDQAITDQAAGQDPTSTDTQISVKELEELTSLPLKPDQELVRGEKAAAFRGSETILVVEDNESVGEYIVAALTMYGYTPIKAQSGQEALSKAADGTRRIDLILTDIIMPDIDGYTLIKALQKLDPMPRVIYMSGYAGGDIVPDDVWNVIQANHRILQKPFKPLTLLKAIRQELDQI